MEAYQHQLVAMLLVSLRIAPTFAFAPPFTLLRTPVAIRLLLSLGLAAWIVLSNPADTSDRPIDGASFVPSLLSELLLGAVLSISLQLAFAALLVAGRAIDIQVGFGLAQIADPSLRTQ